MQRPHHFDRGYDSAHEVQPSVLVRASALVGGGVLVAVAAALPATLRAVGPMGIGGALEQWLILSGITAPLGAFSIAVAQRARDGAKLLFGERVRVALTALLWWATVEIGLLAPFAALLRKATHQHALAGVTFAVWAVVSGVLAAMLARRSVVAVSRGGAANVAFVIALLAAVLVLILIAARTARAEHMHTAAAMLDAIVFGVVTVLASSRPVLRARPLGLAGGPAGLLLLLVGFTLLRFEPELRAALPETAPLHSLLLEIFR